LHNKKKPISIASTNANKKNYSPYINTIMKNLLSKGTSNAKTAKNILETHILYMSPYTQNSKGINICPNASKGCILGCLFTAGRGAFNSIQQARQNRTEFYLSDKKQFCEQIAKELQALNNKAKKQGAKIAIRLNGTSDLDFIAIIKNQIGLDILEAFQNLEFYDYTKILGKVKKYAGTRYKLTFSRAENNEAEAKQALLYGVPVSVVFHHKKDLPKTYLGAPVIDGDKADDLMLEAGAVILGLKAKGRAKKDTSGFVVA